METFLEGSVDHIIYRDHIVNRRSFIYCSLACYEYVPGGTHRGGCLASYIRHHELSIYFENVVVAGFPRERRAEFLMRYPKGDIK